MRQLRILALAPAVLLILPGCSAGESAQSAQSAQSAAHDSAGSFAALDGATAQVAMAPAPEMAGPPVAAVAGASRGANRTTPVRRASVTNTAATIGDVRPGSMMIRTATASVEVTSLDEAVAAARLATVRLGGEVANAHISSGRQELKRATMQILIPTFRFDSLVAGLSPLGRVESVQVSAQDVGEEYVDLEARLANLRRLDARIIELLANRTGKLAEVLEVEHELARVRGEIEQIEGRRRYLARWVSVSTLNLVLHEPVPVLAESVGSNPITAAFRQAWRQLVGMMAWSITFLATVIPLVVILSALAMAIRFVWGRRDAAASPAPRP